MKWLWVFLLIVVIEYAFTQLLPVREGFFFPPPSYSVCRDQGYTKEFCVQTPVAQWGPGVCRCPSGEVGMITPGFRGQCICRPYTTPWL